MISVIIATKNGKKYISRAIESTLKQTAYSMPGFEIVVISDGSTDGTAEYVRTMYPSITFPVRVLENTESQGPGKARALAIQTVTNPYIAILDDDDWYINTEKLSNQIKALEENQTVVVVGAERTEFVSENGTHLSWYLPETDPQKIHNNMLLTCPVVNSSVVFRKSTYDSVGGLSDLRLAEDYDLWLRMGKVGSIINIPNTETAYTLRRNSASGSNGKHSTKLAMTHLQLVRKYKHDYPNYTLAVVKSYLRILKKGIFGF